MLQVAQALAGELRVAPAVVVVPQVAQALAGELQVAALVETGELWVAATAKMGVP